MDRNCPWTVAQDTAPPQLHSIRVAFMLVFSTLLKRGASQGLSPRSSTLSCLESWKYNLQESHHHWGLLATELRQTLGPLSLPLQMEVTHPIPPSPPHPFPLPGKLDKKAPDAPDLAPHIWCGHLDHTTSVPHAQRNSPPTIKKPSSQSLSLAFSCLSFPCFLMPFLNLV